MATAQMKLSLGHNSLIVPVDPDAAPMCEAQSIFAEKDAEFEWTYLFDEVFTGHEILAVIRIPDFDPDDLDQINEAMDDYEKNPDAYLKDSYEIARVYH